MDLKAVAGYQYHNRLHNYQGKLFIGRKTDLKEKILAELHYENTGGHLGFKEPPKHSLYIFLD